jgi:hypothetical protein
MKKRKPKKSLAYRTNFVDLRPTAVGQDGLQDHQLELILD